MNERGDCYCQSLWKDTKRMKRRKIPPGFCGICLCCSQPGHTRHSPLPVPATEAYCDACFDSLATEYDAWRSANPEGFTVDFVEQRRRRQKQARPNNALHLTPTAAASGFARRLASLLGGFRRR